MLKVASRSWLEAVRPAAAQEGAAPVHVHFMNDRTLDMLSGLRHVPDKHQTIANQFMLRDLLRKGAATRVAIDQAIARGETIRVVSGMRDPVARSLSLVHFFADFYGDTSRKLTQEQGGEPADMARAVVEFWQMALEGIEPADSFGRLLSFLIGAYRNWFSEELGAVLGVCLGQESFPVGAGAECLEGRHAKVLLYRLEDLAPQTPSFNGLLARASTFLDAPLASLPQVNTAASRRSFTRFEATHAALCLPPYMLNAIYDDPVVRRFYTAAEIDGFRRRWGGVKA